MELEGDEGRLKQILSDKYKVLDSVEVKAYMSNETKIPTAGGVLYVETNSRDTSVDQSSLLSSETKLTFYLNSLYPEESDVVGNSIKDAATDLLRFDLEYIENRYQVLTCTHTSAIYIY